VQKANQGTGKKGGRGKPIAESKNVKRPRDLCELGASGGTEIREGRAVFDKAKKRRAKANSPGNIRTKMRGQRNSGSEAETLQK